MKIHKRTATAVGMPDGVIDWSGEYHSRKQPDPEAKDPVVAEAEATLAMIQEARMATDGRIVNVAVNSGEGSEQ